MYRISRFVVLVLFWHTCSRYKAKIALRYFLKREPREEFISNPVAVLQVGSTSLAGKEALVLKGLESKKRNIDEFLSYFPTSEIDAAKAKIDTENKLNLAEFDPALGAPINLPPKS